MRSVASCENPSLTMTTAQSDKNLTIAVKVYDNLIGELRCPSCACPPMKAPIKLCESGHATCYLCQKILAKCPLCLKPFADIRSLTLEAMAAKAQFKCSNSTLGCPVRLQVSLLGKHEEQCAYQLGHCFMGKVWGNCKWHGREIDWIEHCELDHREKVFFGAEVTRTWELKRDPPKPICAFYIFRVYNEIFNFYQIYDNLRNILCWTMMCASKNPNTAKRYSFEIELYSPTDDSKIAVQRNPCHSDRDAGILRQSAIFGLGEIMRFMDKTRILHYRIKVLENTQTKRMSTFESNGEARSRFFQTDFTQTNIEGSNIKKIPSEKIITRRTSKSFSQNGCMTGPPTSGSSSSSASSSSKEGSLKNCKLVGEAIRSVGNNNATDSMMTDEDHIMKTNSIDQTIIENKDLKSIFVRSYHIDVKNIVDFLDDTTMSKSKVNTIPKPPRMSLDMERADTDETQLLRENASINASPQSSNAMKMN